MLTLSTRHRNVYGVNDHVISIVSELSSLIKVISEFSGGHNVPLQRNCVLKYGNS